MLEGFCDFVIEIKIEIIKMFYYLPRWFISLIWDLVKWLPRNGSNSEKNKENTWCTSKKLKSIHFVILKLKMYWTLVSVTNMTEMILVINITSEHSPGTACLHLFGNHPPSKTPPIPQPKDSFHSHPPRPSNPNNTTKRDFI